MLPCRCRISQVIIHARNVGGADMDARAAGVPCLAVTSPVGLDPETGARRRGAPGADATIALHRPIETLVAEEARHLVGQLLVAPVDLPRDADTAAR